MDLTHSKHLRSRLVKYSICIVTSIITIFSSKTNKCHQSSSEEFLQFFIFHSQSVHFLLDLIYPGGLLQQYSSLLLMTLKLPEKTVLQSPEPPLNASTPLLHGLAHHRLNVLLLERRHGGISCRDDGISDSCCSVTDLLPGAHHVLTPHSQGERRQYGVKVTVQGFHGW